MALEEVASVATAKNWSATLDYRADSIAYPSSIVELQDLVAGAHRVKALGTRHSFTPVADSPRGLMVSLETLEPCINIDETAMTVTATGGTSYGVLANELHRHGFALRNLASLPHISIAGGTATGTHGSGDANQVLAASIRGVRLVCADGTIAVVEGPDLDAVAVGIGGFGVITHLTLEIVPTYVVQQEVYRHVEWDAVLTSFDAVMGSAYSVSLLGDFADPKIRTLWLKARLEDGDAIGMPESAYGGWRLSDGDLAPGNSLTPLRRPGSWSERMAHFRLDGEPSARGDELQSEYFVDRRYAVAALSALRNMGDEISPHLHGFEVRTLAADDLWLSPAHERDCVCIGFTWRKHPEEVDALLPVVESALEPFDARPHWGKLFALRDLSRRFPRLNDWLRLRDEYDPEGKFRAGFIEDVLGP